MRKSILLAAVGLAMTWTPPAAASVYGDDLTRCIGSHTSAADNIALTRWMFVAMAASPSIKSLSNISDTQRNEINRTMGQLFSRLLTRDCRSQTVAALKYDGIDAVKTAFGMFGQFAMESLMRDPAVTAGLGGFTAALDAKALEDVIREAGLKPPAI